MAGRSLIFASGFHAAIEAAIFASDNQVCLTESASESVRWFIDILSHQFW